MSIIQFSLVLYKHSVEDVLPLLESIENLSLSDLKFSVRLGIYDCSSGFFPIISLDRLEPIVRHVDLKYYVGKNLGYGRANNYIYNRSQLSDDDIFIITNPDISFDSSVFSSFFRNLHPSLDFSCLAPLIRDHSGIIQRSVKKDPTFLSLLAGKFSFLTLLPCIKSYDRYHKNLQYDYEKETIHSSYLSGCFLIVPSCYYRLVRGFSPEYFLHLEDADLVRKLSLVGPAFHFPEIEVCHKWARGSHSSFSQMISLFKSMILYFYKWGFRFT